MGATLGAQAPLDARTLQGLWQPHLPRLYRICLMLESNPEDAAELLQDALVRAWQNRGTYQGTGSVFGWLYRIVQNQHIDRVRRTARRRTLWQRMAEASTTLWDAMLPEQTPQELLERFADEHELADCLREVPEPFRTVVHLCDIEELDYGTEIGRAHV